MTIPENKLKPDWQLGLLKSMRNPKAIVATDAWVTVIKDAYPKAEKHYLILPKAYIRDLKALNSTHLPILRHMEKVAKYIIDIEDKSRTFMLGYHAEPSIKQLHMHIISNDLNSKFLKTKRHWNSFTTDFFLKPEDVAYSIETKGYVSILTPEQCEQYLKAPLVCHKCTYYPKDMPDLKRHILIHK
ncbi:aprataxin [Diorhabda carinulata]|uniref:aprataxin n=1 Tax=Diorhabda carinulata TaxID=1163345 RepID=UPI0025A310F4|nr:aprataxin [Diorhabda carinulata]